MNLKLYISFKKINRLIIIKKCLIKCDNYEEK